MKSLLVIVLVLLAFLIASCSKKESGVCYCTYVKGDNKEFDLRSLDKQKQIDSCNQLSQNASHFGGSCKLKK
ncbi:MAG TPA: hypothetical protein VLZ83_10000 [Edaphocola sp.]|nr:hypothetical protein [Edaphocola sp.]